jgi:16S rRNA (cytidine1402-2'-O)-methyltransferase
MWKRSVVGILYLVATPIGNRMDISPRAVETLKSVRVIAAEDTRHTGRLLEHLGIETPMMSYHKLNERRRRDQLLAALVEGDVALVSDAGMPGISDPGFHLVEAATSAGFRVSPIPGPSSAIAAVAASGLVPGPFFFQGFLPRKGYERRRALSRAAASGVPVVIFEAANRLVPTLNDLAQNLGLRPVAVARELTKLHEEIRRGSLEDMIAHYEAVPPRGEIVIIVGVAANEEPDPADAEPLVQSLLSAGLSVAEVAREVAATVGIPRSEAYTLARQIKAERVVAGGRCER